MGMNTITSLVQSGIFEIFKLVLPILGSALIIGLIVSIFQAVTSIQESTLTFLPKLIVIFIVIALFSGFMFTDLSQWTINVFRMIPKMAK